MPAAQYPPEPVVDRVARSRADLSAIAVTPANGSGSRDRRCTKRIATSH